MGTAPLFELTEATERAPKRGRQAELGQFLTPPHIADFMAGMFGAPRGAGRLLEAGAGKGALVRAFAEMWRGSCAEPLDVDAYECDELVLPSLADCLRELETSCGITYGVHPGNFIFEAATAVKLARGKRYTHCIINPPYKKISSQSRERGALRSAGLETVNLYTGFVGLALELLEDGGEMVAIIPRSFCNGPYYEPFRRFILSRAAILRMHLFESRNSAFKADGVLQENIIVHLKRGAAQGNVRVSLSRDDTFSDVTEVTHPFERIVFPDDPRRFIHVPTGAEVELIEGAPFSFGLADVGVQVSTGPVVDFRVKDLLRKDPEANTVPLLYPGHFVEDRLIWPREGFKKANALAVSPLVERSLYPSGFYTVVRRFSSKEEVRRVVASVIDPAQLPAGKIGIENHLNVLHAGKRPLSEPLARGLAVYLNSSAVDRYFRRFNGHTQVNATDLKTLPYPSRETLMRLGDWAKEGPRSQSQIDSMIEAIR